MSADAPVDQYQLVVHDDASDTNPYSSGFVAVTAPGEPPLDLQKDKLKLALKLSRGGHFTVLLVGIHGALDNGKPAANADQLFWAGKVNVDGPARIDAHLLKLDPGDDMDGDFFPDGAAFLAHNATARSLYTGKENVLDCDDKTDHPPGGDGQPIGLSAAQINPFAAEICGNGYDENCNGNGDDGCIDKDGDGDFKGKDCDDSDPRRHHATNADPFPDPPNCCGYNLGKIGTPEEHTNFLGQAICKFKRCGDGIDESCRATINDKANDSTCVVDNDCDGFAAPPQGNDCDDNDPNVHPGAVEGCDATKDLNCNGTVGEGCVPCDLDGDGYERLDVPNHCPDKADKHPGMADCNDDDAGVYPGSTLRAGGVEGGSSSLAKLNVALSGLCRGIYEPGGVTGTGKINPFGNAVGDADCNGVAFEGCPGTIDPGCDKDGDGWPGVATSNAKNCNPLGVTLDCDDNDPQTYPGAPDNCKTPKAESCGSPLPDCTGDADGDGYIAQSDCDDKNPAVFPFAVEKCNGVDDDCDGMIDEGNPDPSGAPLVQAGTLRTCTDSDTGECANTRGSCVCSIAQPVKDPLLAQLNRQRTLCPGEGIPGKAPSCFGAGQPKAQSCNALDPKDDDCDGATDAPEAGSAAAARLANLGARCGIDVGQCKSGVVVACDHTQNNCFTAFGRTGAETSWWVCSTKAPNPVTVCPTAELCNGFDDDCDGTLAGGAATPTPGQPTIDERDHDTDQYLGCSDCGNLPLASGLKGCGDCNDGDRNIHPGAPETCDGIDNSCAGAGFADGKDDCGKDTYGHTGLPSCCGGFGCKNTKDNTTGQFCGSCTNNCDPTVANMCVNSGCSCGGAPSCTGGRTCTAGKCTFGLGSMCGGDNDCTSGHCTDGHCCTVGSCGTCLACTGSLGTCAPQTKHLPGNGCPDSMGNTVCDGSGHCKENNGQSCMVSGVPQPGVCWNGNCADGYCCDSACSGLCEACDVGGSQGTCTPVTTQRTMSQLPMRTACAGGGTACAGACDGTEADRNACQYPGSGTACPATCTTGSGATPAKVAPGSCNNMGGCKAGTPVSCTNNMVTCNGAGTDCAASCSQDADCITGYFCDGAGSCKKQLLQGVACDDAAGSSAGTCKNAGCAICGTGGGHCVDGFCCDQAAANCNRNCQYCGTQTTTPGTCGPAKISTPGRNVCGNHFLCNGTSTLCPSKCTSDAVCVSGYYCAMGGDCVAEVATTCDPTNAVCNGGVACRQCQGDLTCPASGTCGM